MCGSHQAVFRSIFAPWTSGFPQITWFRKPEIKMKFFGPLGEVDCSMFFSAEPNFWCSTVGNLSTHPVLEYRAQFGVSYLWNVLKRRFAWTGFGHLSLPRRSPEIALHIRVGSHTTWVTELYGSGGTLGTWEKTKIPHLKWQATKPAVLKLSCGPQTSRKCYDVANEPSRNVKIPNGRCGRYGPAIGGLHRNYEWNDRFPIWLLLKYGAEI